jgi:hypothetical protein
MVEQTGTIDVNVSFNDQSHVRDFLNVQYGGPVPEALMRRLHSLTKQAIQQELDRLGLDMKCSGIRLGYDLSEVPEQSVEKEEICFEGALEQHYIECWGCYTQHQALLQHARSVDENSTSSGAKKDNTPGNFVSREFLDGFLSQVQETISSQVPPSTLGGSSVQPWLFGYAQRNRASSLDRPIAFASSNKACCTDADPYHRLDGKSICGGERCATTQKPTDN